MAETELERVCAELREKSESMDTLLLKLATKTQKLQDVEQLRTQEQDALRAQYRQLEVRAFIHTQSSPTISTGAVRKLKMQPLLLQVERDEAKVNLVQADELSQQLKSQLRVSEEREQQLGDQLKKEQQKGQQSARTVTRLRNDVDQLQKVRLCEDLSRIYPNMSCCARAPPPRTTTDARAHLNPLVTPLCAFSQELDEVREFYETTDERTRCRHLITEWEKRDLRKQIREIKSQKNAPALLKRLSLKYHPDKNVAGLQWLFSALQIEINSASMALGDER